MTTFAQIISGKVFDPQPNATEAEYRARNSVFAAAPVVAEMIDDGALHGAVYLGNGNYSNPTLPSPPPAIPVIMTDRQFRKYAAQHLGSSAAVGTIYRNTGASVDSDVNYAFMAWSKAQTYDKSEVATLTSALVTGGIMTSAQRNALLSNWPEA